MEFQEQNRHHEGFGKEQQMDVFGKDDFPQLEQGGKAKSLCFGGEVSS